MADLYELILDVDLVPTLTGDELAELRWHVGETPQPDRLVLGTDRFLPAFPLGDPTDPDCEWQTDDPQPLFAAEPDASEAALTSRSPDGWHLTARQDLHPDQFPALRAFLDWLGPRASTPGPIGHLRWHEDTDSEPLLVENRTIKLPTAVIDHTQDLPW
ncbi:hypothetical protein [Microlunatus parietis]|uniref:Uncharacterized protein n=1 Tax=Microlunatus parietis TaxID=682979 RepID=A0A7Y9I2W7_9ACTN|nr:hypothetical protein [Microlunatus parietis]NYE69188.1 hypothetical protein [Microlunatus parietis]